MIPRAQTPLHSLAELLVNLITAAVLLLAINALLAIGGIVIVALPLNPYFALGISWVIALLLHLTTREG